MKPINLESTRSTRPRNTARITVTAMTTHVDVIVCCLVGQVTFLSSCFESQKNCFALFNFSMLALFYLHPASRAAL